MSGSTDMSGADCLERLAHATLGRVALATRVGPRIVVVHYVVHDGAIVFRTAPYSPLSAYGWNTDLAFEVDDLDGPQPSWSVVAVGRAHIVRDPGELQDIRTMKRAVSLSAGLGNFYVKLAWRELGGLHLGGDWTQAANLPRHPQPLIPMG